MSKKHEIDDEDRDLFRRNVEGTRPLKDRKEYTDPVRKAAVHPRKSASGGSGRGGDDDDRSVSAAGAGRNPVSRRGGSSMSAPASGDVLCFQGPGVQNKEMQRLRRGEKIRRRGGEIPDDDRVCLRGMTLKEAERRLDGFLRDSRTQGKRCVLVVHGKGYSSPDGRSTIKASIGDWLKSRGVLAYCSALQRDGGTGALYVLLKAKSAE